MKVISARLSIKFSLLFCICLRIESRLAIFVPYSLHLISKLLLECNRNSNNNVMSSENLDSSFTKTIVQKPIVGAVSNEELNRTETHDTSTPGKIEVVTKKLDCAP